MTAIFEPETQEKLDSMRRALPTRAARAYGALWRAMGHRTDQHMEAQSQLFQGLSREERRQGIEWAMEKWGEPTRREVEEITIKTEPKGK